MKRFVIVFLLFLLFSLLLSQIEKDDSYYNTHEYESLIFYEYFPLRINNITKEKLKSFTFLDSLDINNIIVFNQKKLIKNEKDLRKAGLLQQKIEILNKYISYSKTNFETFFRIESFKDNLTQISSNKTYSSTTYSSENISFGFNSQKDEGETDFLDYTSSFIKFSTKSKNSLILGNYKIGFGQGIVFGSPFLLNKSVQATNSPLIKRYFVKPNSSFYENWLYNGAVLDFSFNTVSFVPFFSKSHLDATLKDNKISSFYEGGLHQNNSKKDVVEEKILGIYVEKELFGSNIGVSFTKFHFDKGFIDESKNSSYNSFSANYNILLNQITFFGEYATIDKKTGELYGIKFGNRVLNQMWIYRNYEKNLITHRGNPFSASSKFDNEKGLYYGLSIRPNSKLEFNSYLDLWEYPGTSYLEKLPVSGFEQMYNIDYRFDKNQLKVKFKYLQKEEVKSGLFVDKKKYQYKLDYFHYYNRILTSKIRFEYDKEILNNTNDGILAYKKLTIKYPNTKITGQITYYNSQLLIYMYENNISGVSQTTSFKGEDFYYFILGKFKFRKNFYFELKFSDYLIRESKWRIYSKLGYKKSF